MSKEVRRADVAVFDNPALIRESLESAEKLIGAILVGDMSHGYVYQALDRITELVMDADKRFCLHYYDQIPEGAPELSFGELVAGRKIRGKTKSAAANRSSL
ncbi:MAG: hypothetical protein HY918_03765 [Candidatus Doudnabacteria bacterium]|nr:hypothetical protein [Candidatus Doudnabacteria bacterium]